MTYTPKGVGYNTEFGVMVGDTYYESMDEWEKAYKENVNVSSLDCSDLSRTDIRDLIDHSYYRSGDCVIGSDLFKCKSMDSQKVTEAMAELDKTTNVEPHNRSYQRCIAEFQDAVSDKLFERYSENERDFFSYFLKMLRDPSVKEDFLSLNEHMPFTKARQAAAIIQVECEKENAPLGKCEAWKRRANDIAKYHDNSPFFHQYGRIEKYAQPKDK